MLLNSFSLPSSSFTPGANVTGEMPITFTLSPTRNFVLAIVEYCNPLLRLPRFIGTLPLSIHFVVVHCGSSLPDCSATMYAAYQSGQFSSRWPPVRSSCSRGPSPHAALRSPDRSPTRKSSPRSRCDREDAQAISFIRLSDFQYSQ